MSTLEENGITDYKHAARKVSILSCSPSRCLPFLLVSLFFNPASSVDISCLVHSNTPQFSVKDFETFDYIFAMDKSNLSDLQRLQQRNQGGRAKVMLYGEYSGTGKAEVVTDPYYGGQGGFTKAYEQCRRFGGEFLKEVVGEKTS